jgi:hypothetical protein
MPRGYTPAGSRHRGPSCFGLLTQEFTGNASIRSLLSIKTDTNSITVIEKRVRPEEEA